MSSKVNAINRLCYLVERLDTDIKIASCAIESNLIAIIELNMKTDPKIANIQPILRPLFFPKSEENK